MSIGRGAFLTATKLYRKEQWLSLIHILNERGGIITDNSRTTTAPNIFAMGDVTGGLQFTYISLDDYRIVASKI